MKHKTTVEIENIIILDFGCATGILIDYISKKAKKIAVLDSAVKMLAVPKSRNCKKYRNSASELSEKTIAEHPILQEKFALIVAVCIFMPNYQEVLALSSSLLKANGTFTQWDWLKIEQDPNFGFPEDLIRSNLAPAGLRITTVDIPFYMLEKGRRMEVLMAVANL